jgi:hypothetical protein
MFCPSKRNKENRVGEVVGRMHRQSQTTMMKRLLVGEVERREDLLVEEEDVCSSGGAVLC